MPLVICAYCNKEKTVSPRTFATSKSGLFFCNVQEKGLYWKATGKASSEQNGVFKGNVRLKMDGEVYG